jgi:hypothetical protein
LYLEYNKLRRSFMTERQIVRKEKCPIAFKTTSIQYVETGDKKEPQQYTPNKKSCKKHEHKHKHHHHHHHKHVSPVPPIELKWRCSGEPDFVCIQADDGIYTTLEECQFNCESPGPGTHWINVIGGDLNTVRSNHSAFGNGGVACGGGDGMSVIATTETFNGATWTVSGNLNAGREFFGAFGIQSAGVACGGDPGSPFFSFMSTETFNGATWTLLGAGGNLNTARDLFSAFGIQSAGVACGGNVGGPSMATTETFNGASWNLLGAGGNLNTARSNFGAFGIQSAGVVCGGGPGPSTETFNGTTWTLLGASGLLNTARSFFGAFGIQSAGVACGGSPGPLASTETFNGATWTLLGVSGNLNTARFYFSTFGIQSAGVACGGQDEFGVVLVSTEKFVP